MEQDWIWTAVAGGVIAVLVFVRVIVVRKRRKEAPPSPDDIYPLF